MKAIESKLYTNVILTAIAIFLAVLVLRPMLQFSQPAYAQRVGDRARISETPKHRSGEEKIAASNQAVADATRAVAEATNDIGVAIREAAKSQKDIANAIKLLAQ